MIKNITIGYRGITLHLPLPEFSNSESNLDSVNIKRSMVGDVFTTIKKRTLEIFKIKLLLERQHLKRLQVFLAQYGDKPVTYTDHHGDVWIGFIYNDVFDSVEKQTWLNEIDLNFEGYRVI